MFGYVKPYVPELKVREHEYYRRIYCALCHANGKNTGCGSRFSLSYDLVFLALIRMALAGETLQPTQKRCPAHPFRRHPTAQCNTSLQYAARAGALLTYYNLMDKIHDAHGIRKLPYLLLRPAASLMHRRAAFDREQGLEALVSEELHTLAHIEKEPDASPEKAADSFGRLLRSVFAEGLTQNSPNARIAEQIGFHTGRWIYFTDAADDYADDRKHGTFNPFGTDPKTPEHIRIALKMELTQLERAVELIEFPCPEIGALVRNIIYLGMPDAADRAIKHGFSNMTTHHTEVIT